MAKQTGSSETATFTLFIDEVLRLRRILGDQYESDSYLRDHVVQMFIKKDTHGIARSLRENPPATCQEATQRISRILPDTVERTSSEALLIDRKFRNANKWRQKMPGRT